MPFYNKVDQDVFIYNTFYVLTIFLSFSFVFFCSERFSWLLDCRHFDCRLFVLDIVGLRDELPSPEVVAVTFQKSFSSDISSNKFSDKFAIKSFDLLNKNVNLSSLNLLWNVVRNVTKYWNQWHAVISKILVYTFVKPQMLLLEKISNFCPMVTPPSAKFRSCCCCWCCCCCCCCSWNWVSVWNEVATHFLS